MQFNSTDPDIETLVRRIDRERIDLQPDFQRGDVWSRGKQQRLIDTVLRGWHIPPIHLVDRGDGHFDVLDGQQRLTAIRDFMRGKFSVDGNVEPLCTEIGELSGKHWGDLPPSAREQFNNFTIRVFQLTNYEPSEPYELFFRLNQPTNLTEAEKRNAFIGLPRNQIKDLAEEAQHWGMNQERVGFTNSRMAYDEILARFVLCLESGSLTQKLTSARITERYRSGDAFANSVIDLARASLQELLTAITLVQRTLRIKPNKATLHTWLCVAASTVQIQENADTLPRLIAHIEGARAGDGSVFEGSQALSRLYGIFDDRATSRVLDVSSVLLRDFSTWAIGCELLGENCIPVELVGTIREILQGIDMQRGDADTRIYERLVAGRWGERNWI